MLNVRKMEELGGAMGLTETLNSDLTSSSESNNIDVHMEKNTEYGALVILSASSYGNPSKVEDGNTTTGNATGVVMKINGEWVAGGANWIKTSNFVNAVGRYKNIYLSESAKKGDATDETKFWHGSKGYFWFTNYSDFGAFIRSYSGSIFSYAGDRNTGIRL